MLINPVNDIHHIQNNAQDYQNNIGNAVYLIHKDISQKNQTKPTVP